MIIILIVDDKTENLYLLQSMLDTNGFKTIPAKNGAEALGLMRNNIPDLIIADILMPVMDGFTLCRECKKDETLKNIPFFFYTATYIDAKDEEYALSLGADRFILKPQEPDVFLKIVTDFLEEVKKKTVHPKEIIQQAETVVLKEYNEVLIRKIEDKMLQTEKSERELRKYAEKLENEILEHKKSEDSLRKSEEYNRLLFNSSPIGLALCKMDGTLIDINPAYAKIIGRTIEETLKLSYWDITPGIYTSQEKEQSKSLEETGHYGKYEKEYVHKDGHLVPVLLQGLILEQEGERVIWSSVEDITERKKTEIALQESQYLFQTLAQVSPVGIFRTSSDGKTTYVNPKWSELSGLSEKDALGNGWLNAVHHEDREKLSESWMNNLKSKNESSAEYRFVRPDGSITWVLGKAVPEMSGNKLAGYIGTITDITERKLAEEDLQISEKQLSTIYKTVGDVIYYLAIEAEGIYRFISASQTFYSITGLSPDMIIGKLVHEIIPEPSLSVVLEKYRQAIQENAVIRWEEVSDYPTGRLIGDVSIAPVVDESGKCTHLVGSVHDITKRKQAEEALAESEIKYRQLVSQSPDGIFVVDLSGSILSINTSICNRLKYTEEELLSMKLLDIVPEKYHSQHKQRFLAIMNGDTKTSKAEYEVIGKDGIAYFVEVLSVPYLKGKEIAGFQGIARDITERKNAEKIIRESEEKYRRIFENVQDLYYETSMEGRILEVSPSIEILSGGQYRRNDLIGKSIYDFYTETDERDALLLQLKEHGYVSDFEITLKNRDGSKVPCSLSSKVSFEDNGRPDKIIGSMRNITERKNSLEKLKLAKEKAEESDRLKTAFLHNISHEVRTPMNAIVGFSELIIDPCLTPEVRNEFIQTIVQSSNQLLSVITQIVSMATIETGQEKIYEKEISLNCVFKIVSDQYRSEAVRKNISMNFDTALPENEDKIKTDETKLIQIISNLLSNALKFTKKGSIDFGYIIKGKYLEFYFKDTGIGIQEDLHEKIFERFRQVETTLAREYEGSGLGLSISKAYVELLGGKIWLTSRLGEGSVFYFTIPYNIVSLNKIPEIGVADKYISEFKNPITLLVAEDENINFKLLAQYLSNANFVLIHAENGSEALEICKKNRQINIVLMDLKMPVMDGFEATKKIKEFLPDLPILAQTAYSAESDKEKALACGCNDFISKPFRKDELLTMIRKHLVIN